MYSNNKLTVSHHVHHNVIIDDIIRVLFSPLIHWSLVVCWLCVNSLWPPLVVVVGSCLSVSDWFQPSPSILLMWVIIGWIQENSTSTDSTLVNISQSFLTTVHPFLDHYDTTMQPPTRCGPWPSPYAIRPWDSSSSSKAGPDPEVFLEARVPTLQDQQRRVMAIPVTVLNQPLFLFCMCGCGMHWDRCIEMLVCTCSSHAQIYTNRLNIES